VTAHALTLGCTKERQLPLETYRERFCTSTEGKKRQPHETPVSPQAAPGATSREAQRTDTVKKGVNCKHTDHDASIERTTQPTGNSECIPVSRLQLGAFPEPAVRLRLQATASQRCVTLIYRSKHL